MRWSALSAFGFADKFGFRLGLILVLALAPVGILALVRSASIEGEIRARTEAALAGQTLRAAAPVLDQLSQAKGLASGLAGTVAGQNASSCTALMQALVGGDSGIAVAALYDAAGTFRCGSIGSPERVSPRSPIQTALVEGAETPLIIANAGPEAGLVAVAMHQLPRPGNENDAAMALILFDADGNVLSSNLLGAEVANSLPQGRDLVALSEQPPGMFVAETPGGPRRIYSLNELIADRVFALGSWPDQRNPVETVNAMSPLIIPAATLAACLIAAWMAAEMMVTRHMRRFRRAITAFSRGDRKIDRLEMPHAPGEIRQAAEAFGQMTDTILQDEAELEDAVRQREALLREVHHRVKNNLQLMASILNLQIRRTRSDEAKKIMRRLQDRMLSLATVHNSLFHTASLTEVQADRLFAGIVDQVIVANTSLGLSTEIETDFGPLLMSPEQIVPLALLLTEALGRAIRDASAQAQDRTARIRVSLRRTEGDTVILTISHAIPADGQPTEPEMRENDDIVLGNQLIHAFALQLAGTYRQDREAGQEVQSVRFQLAPAAA